MRSKDAAWKNSVTLLTYGLELSAKLFSSMVHKLPRHIAYRSEDCSWSLRLNIHTCGSLERGNWFDPEIMCHHMSKYLCNNNSTMYCDFLSHLCFALLNLNLIRCFWHVIVYSYECARYSYHFCFPLLYIQTFSVVKPLTSISPSGPKQGQLCSSDASRQSALLSHTMSCV